MTAQTEMECWFCPTCQMLMLWCVALDGQCCQRPERADCPLPPQTPGGYVLLEMATTTRMQRERRLSSAWRAVMRSSGC